MRPDEEDALWASEANPYGPGTPPDKTLSLRFPELVRANGLVDTQEALVSLLDRIKDLEGRVESLGGKPEGVRKIN